MATRSYYSQDENLQITNLQKCGDGFSVDISGIDDWEVETNTINIQNEEVINISLLGKDDYNRIKTIAQSFIYINENGRGSIAVNSRLMGEKIKLKAMLGSEIVYNAEYDNPSFCETNESNENWILIAVAVAALVISAIDYKSVGEYDGDGKLTKKTVTKSFGGAKASSTPIDFEDRNGNFFTADHLYIESTISFDSGISERLESKPYQIQLMFCNINQLTVKDEIY